MNIKKKLEDAFRYSGARKLDNYSRFKFDSLNNYKYGTKGGDNENE